jgi:hypothetical protein
LPKHFPAAIFLSAFLLFALEPLVAKRILPWFGGSAAVWSTCLVFYQTMLLLGYLYARLTTRWLRSGRQSALHLGLLLVSLTFLPIGPTARWRPSPTQDPFWMILAALTAAIGLPFLIASGTSPLLQDWLARGRYRTPYRLFALSNFASLVALLAYTLLIEPFLNIRAQSLGWSALYVVFAGLCGLAAWRSRCDAAATEPRPRGSGFAPSRPTFWFSLSACGSMLLLSITNHLDENIAAVPLLWILPLAIYLLSFVIAFGWHKAYGRGLWLRCLAFVLGVMGYAAYNIDAVLAFQIVVPLFLIGLFVACLFCNFELNRLRPDSSQLTMFYLVVAAGGAAGAIFVGLIAPHIFSGIYELPVTLILTAALALLLVWREGDWALRLLWVAVAACMVVVLAKNVQGYRQNALSLRRSFYGSLRVVQSPHAGPDETRSLFHGTIEHGAEFLWPDRRNHPTTYYGPDSGIGIVLRECFSSPKRVGIVGLGAGTIAAYGKPGDTFRFYEINPQVIEIARNLFFYLRESRANIQIVPGDARVSLEADSSPPFDVLALDAFSGDAIPVHLLTKQAIALYKKHLKANGVLAFHVSNDYLDLAPLVSKLANVAGYQSVAVRNHQDRDELILPSEWVLVTNNPDVLENATVKIHSEPIPPHPRLRVWTDDYNNLLEVLKMPNL